jgi:putative membrane protein insertion efficiency factor
MKIEEPTAPRGFGRRVGLALIALYQAAHAGRPSPCRYWPSCSVYASEAIELHGLWRGSRLAGRRLLRCRPWGPHGVDLVPLEMNAGR